MFSSPGDSLFNGISHPPLSPHDWYLILFVWGKPKDPTVCMPDVLAIRKAPRSSAPLSSHSHCAVLGGHPCTSLSTGRPPSCPAHHSEVAPLVSTLHGHTWKIPFLLGSAQPQYSKPKAGSTGTGDFQSIFQKQLMATSNRILEVSELLQGKA